MKLALVVFVASLAWGSRAFADSPPMDACMGKSQEGDSCKLPTGGSGTCAKTTYQKVILGSAGPDGQLKTREASYMKCVVPGVSGSGDGGGASAATPTSKRGCSVVVADIPPNPPPGRCRCSSVTFADSALLLATCVMVTRRRNRKDS